LIYFTSLVDPISNTLPLTYSWQIIDQPPITHTVALTDTVGFVWESPGTYDITITATNLAGTVSDTHVITIAPSTYEIYLLLVQKSS
jgi:hypothetical protein